MAKDVTVLLDSTYPVENKFFRYDQTTDLSSTNSAIRSRCSVKDKKSFGQNSGALTSISQGPASIARPQRLESSIVIIL